MVHRRAQDGAPLGVIEISAAVLYSQDREPLSVAGAVIHVTAGTAA
jgi:hypothetical protein